MRRPPVFFVREALTAVRENWLQVAFVDATTALRGRFHGFGPWNPCPVETLQQEEGVHVQFQTRWFTGSVVSSKTQSKAARVRFHIDGTEFFVRDKRHNVTLHHPPQSLPSPPPMCHHQTLAPALLSVPPALPPYRFPYSSQPVDTNPYGDLFRYPGSPPILQVSSLSEWCCSSGQTAWQNETSGEWLWVYLDGSWDNPLAGSAAILCSPDGTTLALVIPCPFPSSKDAEFWAFVQCTSYLESVGFAGSLFHCIDNSQLVGCIEHRRSDSPTPPASTNTQGTWQAVVNDLLTEVEFNVGAIQLKSHVGFPGKELPDTCMPSASSPPPATATRDSHFQGVPWHTEIRRCRSQAAIPTAWLHRHCSIPQL